MPEPRPSPACRHHRLAFALRVACVLALAAGASPVHAATFTVDSMRDGFDVLRGDGLCADPLGRCTLRAAIMESNAIAGPDTIVIPAGHYELTLAGNNENGGWSGDLDIDGDLTLAGAGPALTIIDANAIDRVIDIHAGASERTVSLHGVTLRNGRLDPPLQGDGGAGLRSAAGTRVLLEDVAIRDNRSENIWTGIAADIGGCLRGRHVRVIGNRSYSAGAIVHVHGIDENAMACIELEDSEFRGNLGMRAGALHADYAHVAIRRTLVTDNEASSGAGAFNFNLGAPALLENVTISGNRGHVGALMNDGFSHVDIRNSTITRNGSTKTMQAAAGGILDVHGGFGMVHLHNTILAGNEQGWGFADCNRANSDGGNILGNTQGCTFDAHPSDQLDVDPALGPLVDNGGATLTHRPGAAAVDRGNDADCPSTDQRGRPRPLDGDGDGTARCDIGAHELDERLFADGFDSAASG